MKATGRLERTRGRRRERRRPVKATARIFGSGGRAASAQARPLPDDREGGGRAVRGDRELVQARGALPAGILPTGVEGSQMPGAAEAGSNNADCRARVRTHHRERPVRRAIGSNHGDRCADAADANDSTDRPEGWIVVQGHGGIHTTRTGRAIRQTIAAGRPEERGDGRQRTSRQEAASIETPRRLGTGCGNRRRVKTGQRRHAGSERRSDARGGRSCYTLTKAAPHFAGCVSLSKMMSGSTITSLPSRVIGMRSMLRVALPSMNVPFN